MKGFFVHRIGLRHTAAATRSDSALLGSLFLQISPPAPAWTRKCVEKWLETSH